MIVNINESTKQFGLRNARVMSVIIIATEINKLLNEMKVQLHGTEY